MKFKLYQLKNKVDYMFMNYDYALAHGLHLDDYEVVYEDDIVPGRYIEDTLEKLFFNFNTMKPKDFTGWSMSVSDIVEIGGEFYYTDMIGFKVIDNRGLLQ